jgi:formiminoglutamate deiminase
VPVSRFWCQYAWLPTGPAPDVLVEVDGGLFSAVQAGVSRPADAADLAGLTLPGLANAHSHAFHRVLRGRAEIARGTFWTWREQMYAVAARLDPDNYRTLARAVYGEMALAGICCVGEFHYVHHAGGGEPYADPNAMSAALVAAAAEAGIRITLLDTCYLSSTVDGSPLVGVQRRFGDGSAQRWASRVEQFRPAGSHARLGAAIHSVRAVPLDQMGTVVGWAEQHQAPLHVHVSEQRAENEACLAHYGRTPTEVLDDAGALGPRTTVVHATHLSDSDRTELGDTETAVCLCPTTERYLADGIGPARALAEAGSPLCLGSDSHAVIDMFEEARALELHERLRTLRRGNFAPRELVSAATSAGHAALGWPDAGSIAPGQRADLVTVTLASVRTAGVRPSQVVYAASAADVIQVIVDGRLVVREGVHCAVSDVACALGVAIEAVSG